MILIIGAFGSCGVKELEKPSPFTNNIKPGESFCVKLPEDHTKAELWGMAQSYNQRVVENVNTVWHGNDKGIYFHFKGKNKGQTQLVFFKRKFADTIEKKAFTVKVSQE